MILHVKELKVWMRPNKLPQDSHWSMAEQDLIQVCLHLKPLLYSTATLPPLLDRLSNISPEGTFVLTVGIW